MTQYINPLERYKREEKATWKEIIEITGLPESTIFTFRQYNPRELLGVKMKTALVFKQTLGINLLEEIDKLYEYYKEY